MFGGDDDDFEFDEEFLDGIYDAEKSAIQNDPSLEQTLNGTGNSAGCEIESSPAKKRKTSFSPISPVQEKQFALRSSEESARLIASVAQRHALSQKNCTDTDRQSERTNCQKSIVGNNIFKQPSQQNDRFCSENSSAQSPGQNAFSPEVSFNLNTSRVRQRKFPGPAGLLPERGRSHLQGQRPNFSSLLNVSGSDLDEAEEPLSLCSQSTASVLEDGPWRTLQSDLSDGGQELLQRYTVAWVKQKSAARQLVGQKVPFLAAVLHSIDCSSPDPCVVLRDSTGEIPGTLHRSVWDSFGGQLIAGSALVLRFVGVLSTGVSARRHYLNITSNNIVTIYSSPLCESSTSESSSRVRKTDVHKWTLNQLLQAANSWEEQSKKKKQVNTPPLSIQRSENPFTSNVFGSDSERSTSSARPVLPSSSRSNNIPPCIPNPFRQSTSNATGASSTSGRPVQAQGRSNNFPPSFPTCSSNSHTSLGRSQVPIQNRTLGQNSSPTVSQGQKNFDQLRQHTDKSNTSGNSGNSASTGQNRFVPKRPTFSFGNMNQSSVSRTSSIASSVLSQENVQKPTDSETSRGLFSDADDIDISSVLDGIDSESLFGDF